MKQTDLSSNNQQQFKYHLNHLRPPSLVPITIVQQTPSFANDQTMAASTNPGAEWRAIVSSGSKYQHPNNGPYDDELAARLSDSQASGVSASSPELTQSTSLYLSLTNHPRQLIQLSSLSNASLLEPASESDRLVQLQLPLQLHLKLRPLPLPMPPPSDRAKPTSATATAWQDGLETKRKRSLEQVAAQEASSSTFQPTSSPPPQTAATTQVTSNPSPGKSNGEAARRQTDMMALTWREAKRILLLSSMSPVLVQAKLERRFAELPVVVVEDEQQQRQKQKVNNSERQVEDESGSLAAASLTTSNKLSVGEKLAPLKRRKQSLSLNGDDDDEATATTTTSTTSIAPMPSSASDAPHWRAGSYGQQQVVADHSAGQQQSALSGAEFSGRLAKSALVPRLDINLALASASASATTTATDESPTTSATTASKTNDSSPSTSKGEVRRQRHSSQQVSKLVATSFFSLPIFLPAQIDSTCVDQTKRR